MIKIACLNCHWCDGNSTIRLCTGSIAKHTCGSQSIGKKVLPSSSDDSQT